jgi:hypothetical protein
MLRWFQERDPMPTAAQVRAYAERHFLTMMEAKARLLDHSPLRLQMRDVRGKWIDVPTVIEERAVPTRTAD